LGWIALGAVLALTIQGVAAQVQNNYVLSFPADWERVQDTVARAQQMDALHAELGALSIGQRMVRDLTRLGLDDLIDEAGVVDADLRAHTETLGAGLADMLIDLKPSAWTQEQYRQTMLTYGWTWALRDTIDRRIAELLEQPLPPLTTAEELLFAAETADWVNQWASQTVAE
jgi:hypothetical protein